MKERMDGSKVTHLNRIARQLHSVLEETCYICRNHLPKPEITKDHVFPKSMGFSIESNLMPAHFECNNNKADRLPTFDEIELTQSCYDLIGMPFDPRIMLSSRNLLTKPLSYHINKLKEDA